MERLQPYYLDTRQTTLIQTTLGGYMKKKADFEESYRVFGNGIISVIMAAFLAVLVLMEEKP